MLFLISSKLLGYIGYLPSDKSIYVTFRGSSSIQNWVTNLDAVKTPYTTFPECNCQVHKGFFDAEQKVFPSILNAVTKLRSVYPTYSVKVTGHSLGAALAQLTSMDLIKNGLANSVYNFGMPRTGTRIIDIMTSTISHSEWMTDIISFLFSSQKQMYTPCRRREICCILNCQIKYLARDAQ
jgi:predicted lipase